MAATVPGESGCCSLSAGCSAPHCCWKAAGVSAGRRSSCSCGENAGLDSAAGAKSGPPRPNRSSSPETPPGAVVGCEPAAVGSPGPASMQRARTHHTYEGLQQQQAPCQAQTCTEATPGQCTRFCNESGVTLRSNMSWACSWPTPGHLQIQQHILGTGSYSREENSINST